MLSNRIIRAVGPQTGCPTTPSTSKFHGSAGQSFGAWLAIGRDLEVEGDANDYVGKGLSGGRIIIYPPKEATLQARGQHPHRQRRALRRHRRRMLLPRPGRRALLRAQQRRPRGRRGRRRSRLRVHDRRRVVILGPTGRNFAAGMSGGIAYVWDPDATASGPQLQHGDGRARGTGHHREIEESAG